MARENSLRRFTSAALVAATAVLGTLCAPGVAQAADPGNLQTVHASPQGITVMSLGALPDFAAHLRKKGSETRVKTITSWTYTNDCEPSCMEDYYRSGPLALADLGVYSVDIEYKGTEGETVLHKDAGELDYRPVAVFQNAAASRAVSLDSLGTTVSADLAARDPRDGKLTPLAGRQVTLDVSGRTRTATTDAAGHLSVPVEYTGTEPSGRIALLPAPGDYIGTQGSVTPVVETQKVKVALDEGSREVTAPYGSSVTVRGSIHRVAKDGTEKPVATAMRLAIPNTTVSGFSSDAAGRFAKSARILKSTTWQVGAAHQQPWLDYSTTAAVKATATAGTAFTNVWTGIDKNRVVYAQGLLVQRATTAAEAPATVELQYSADGRTGWTTRASVVTVVSPTGRFFNLPNVANAPVDGYWRLRYAGRADLAGSVSARFRLTKTVTTVAGFNVNPEPAVKGKALTLTGTLKQRAASSTTWKPYGGQTVRFYFKADGSTAYAYMGSTTTAADGTINRRFTAKASGTWQAKFYDNGATHFASRSREDHVAVTG
ncbi:hypothetical protein GCM10010305_12110 [Streptomyces termitum]|uniref:Uncharacterized protein n=1 Tax=Streptomyces termitum TaxID=67368 RepID=A0A918SUB9_9ACTN|nr:hypothetical protein GCM10010305_12110 [Streptomyces termitum]